MKLRSFQMRRTLPGQPKCGRLAPSATHTLNRLRARAEPALSSVAHVSRGISRLRSTPTACRRRSRSGLQVNALVAVDYSQPAIWLGLGLIGGGLSLYQLRRVQPLLSRDFDIVVSSVVIFSGGILIFQGWRLDPLLLFCQLLTAGTALAWALEAIKLRKLVENDQRFDERSRQYPPPMEGQSGMGLGRGIPLPPPRETDIGRWYGQSDSEYEELPTASGQGFYSGRGQDAYGPAGSSGGGYGPGDSYYGREAEGQYDGYSDGGYYDEYSDRPGGPQEPQRGGTGWGVVDDVESFYNRPGSVVEDVERFYSSGGGEEERPGQQDVGTAGPGVRSAGQQETGSDDWQGQYYGGNQSGYYSDYPPQGGGREWPSSGQSQQDGNSQYPGYNPRQASDSERNDSGPRAPSR